ncbi:restriction endonuclease subunit S [Desulfogranum marinum]|uniref:restriction endonuclease subunit S n=1 Tax=Desulfogranum marinum TaxID=453220 RepID=UPI0029C7F2A0|nr:restriction endonuclease subunit S [Desulfogranum marinum]
MGNEWTLYLLSELAHKITKGTTPTKKEGGFSSSGVNFIKAEAVTLNGTIDISKFAYITDEIYNKYKRSQLEENDILFSMAGVVLGKTAIVMREHLPANTNQALALIRPRSEVVYPKYLHYFLQQRSIFHYVNNSTAQSAQPNINLQEIGELEINVPSYSKQKAIALILGNIDDRIELNRKMNETLEAMALALFKSWFVDFDPVIDNALASGKKVPEELAERAAVRAALGDKRKPLPADIRALFFDEFTFTDEIGWIPKGWEVGQMQDHSIIEMGQSPKGDTYNTDGIGVPLVNGPVEFGEYFAKKAKWTTSPTKLSEPGDLIVCVRGSTTGRYVKSDDRYCLGRGVCIFRAMRSQNFVDQVYKQAYSNLLGLATGSTFPNWSRKTLSNFAVIAPKFNIIDKYDSIVDTYVSRKEVNVRNSTLLTHLRDTLLPKLLSGELRIPDAEKIVTEAGL